MINHDQARQNFIDRYRGFRVDVPTGWYYGYSVEQHAMTPEQVAFGNVYAPELDRFSELGTYTTLRKYGHQGNPYRSEVVMSDDLCEVADHQALVDYAIAHAPLQRVAINGLGLGVAIELLAPYVQQFTIIELSRAVIHLVESHYRAKYPGRVEIINVNAFRYQPTQHFDAVFHDIWTYISPKNLRQMNRLERLWKPHCDWQQSWARPYCEQIRNNEHPAREIIRASDGSLIFID